MSNINLIKELREKTGIGMSECKKALEETGYDLEKSISWLREKGKAKAGKKAGRATHHGLAGCKSNNDIFSVVSLACETDFVAMGDMFVNLVNKVLDIAVESKCNDVDCLLKYNDNQVDSLIKESIGVIGENIELKQCKSYDLSNQNFSYYIHNASPKGKHLGNIVSSVLFKGDNNDEIRKVAMHAAAVSPDFLDINSVDQSAIDEERRIYTQQAKESGKPESIIAKMVEGRMKKYYQESVLLEQDFVIDNTMKVKDFIKSLGDIELLDFSVIKIGH